MGQFDFFVSFPLFFLNSLSVIRNFSAIAITFYGYKYIKRGEFLKYVLVVLIASLFHKTAIIAILFYFLGNIHFKKSMSIIMLAVLPFISELINKMILKYIPRYAVYTSVSSVQEGTKAIYILVLIGLLALVFREKLIQQSPTFHIRFNIFFVGLCIYLMFFKQGTMGHRLSLSGTIYSLLIVPDIIKLFKHKTDILKKLNYIRYTILDSYFQLKT